MGCEAGRCNKTSTPYTTSCPRNDLENSTKFLDSVLLPDDTILRTFFETGNQELFLANKVYLNLEKMIYIS